MGLFDKFGLILLGIAILAIIGFLRQFGLLKGKNFLYALSAGAAFLGFAIFQTWRKSLADKEFKEREKALAEKEKQAKELEKAVELSNQEVQRAEAALRQERGEHAKRIADIEAEKQKDLQEARERNSNMSIDELTSSVLGS